MKCHQQLTKLLVLLKLKLELPKKVNQKKLEFEIEGGEIIAFDKEHQVISIKPLTAKVALRVFYKHKLLTK